MICLITKYFLNQKLLIKNESGLKTKFLKICEIITTEYQSIVFYYSCIRGFLDYTHNSISTMKQFYLFIGIMLCVLFVYPQSETKKNRGGQSIEKQYENFKKTFDKEVGDEAGTDTKEQVKFVSHLRPCELPGWMLQFKTLSGTDQMLVFGISDPGIDTALAIQQAKIRALGLLSIFRGAMIQNITDIYSNETGYNDIVGKFTSYSKIEAVRSVTSGQLEIIEQGFTRYGEAIVLAGIKESAQVADIDKPVVVADYFISEEGEYDDLFVYSTYNFRVEKSGVFSSKFSCHNTKRSILIKSTHNNRKIEFDYGRFKYYFQQEITISEEDMFNYSYADLSDGLWNAYLSGILRQFEMAEIHTSEIKRMGDQYSGKFQNLSREISNIQLGFELSGIFIKDNKLYVKLNTLPGKD